MFKTIDDIKAYVTERLQKGEKAAFYKKTAWIKARKGFPGEEIITKMANGLTETKNVVKKGDWIITNPDGESYIMPEETLQKKYEMDPAQKGVWRPKGGPQKMLSVTEDISFKAPWGEDMKIAKGGMLNISGMDQGDIYGIQPAEFKKTYAPCDEKGAPLASIMSRSTERS